MHKMPGPKVRVVATKAVAIRAMANSYGHGCGQACG